MTLGSLFDVSGGFPLGAILCGITPVWAAEVEPYPIKVTKTRIPFMKHLGNVTEIDGAKIEPVDIITFGSPCQDLSIAGKRAAGSTEESAGKAGKICLNDQGGQRMDVTEDVTCTLRAEAHHPPVAYGIDRASFNMGKNARFGFSIEEEMEPTIVSRGPGAVAFADKAASLSAADGPKGPSSQMMKNPEENFVGEPKTLKIRCGKEGGGKGALIQTDKSATPSCNNDQTLFEPTWSASKNSYHTNATKELANTLMATDYKDPPIINDEDDVSYIVRRLTPTECARLQGFPDWWCDDLENTNPSEEDMEFWRKVFKTYYTINGKKTVKTDKQIVKWLSSDNGDSAKYKMWGNGVALPNVIFVLSGIAALNFLEEENEE